MNNPLVIIAAGLVAIAVVVVPMVLRARADRRAAAQTLPPLDSPPDQVATRWSDFDGRGRTW